MKQETTQGWLHSFFDAIDIAKNMNEVEEFVIEGPEGAGAFLYSIAMLVLAGITGVLAYVFDLQSTWDGMNALTTFIIPQLPESQIHITQQLGIVFTLAPTFAQAFSAGLAKKKVPLVTWLVIGFSAFDVVTDIPRAMAFTLTLQDQFNQLGLLAWVGQTCFFVMWLFLSTIGFEVLFVIFSWAFLLFIGKSLGIERATKIHSRLPKFPQMGKQNKANGQTMPSGQAISIADVINNQKRD